MPLRPAFLPAHWPNLSGWRLPHMLPYPLDQAENLMGEPWDRFLFVLKRAMAGDFRYGETLVELIASGEQIDGLEVLAGATLRHHHLQEIVEGPTRDGAYTLEEVIEASYWVGSIEALLSPEIRREHAESVVYDLVEERLGTHSSLLPGDTWPDRVRNSVEALTKQFPATRHFVHGQALHPSLLVEELCEYAARSDDELREAEAVRPNLLLRIETLTGIAGETVIVASPDWGYTWHKSESPGKLTTMTLEEHGETHIDREALLRNMKHYRSRDYSLS